MAKVILICGRLCCGKSTYAEKLCSSGKTVLLSVDEIMLRLFGQHCGDRHDEYTLRVKEYLTEKAVQLINADVNVVFDWGFWLKSERQHVKRFFDSRNIPCELHFINVCDDEWKHRIKKRNQDVLSGKTEAYYVDDNLLAKLELLFEPPDGCEIDVIADAD